MVKRIITQAIVGTAVGKNYSHRRECETFTVLEDSVHIYSKQNKGHISSEMSPTKHS